MVYTTIPKWRNNTCRTRTENNKSAGTDGIPGEIYKELARKLAPFLIQIANNILTGQTMPGRWADVAVVHIRKKPSTTLCNNYRPIFLTQIIYKIWPKLQTQRLSHIMHLLTSNIQYGYKNGLSAIDAILKIEHAIHTGPKDTKIILMGLSKDFDCVNHTLLRAALYKMGLPLHTIFNIQKGHQNTTIRCKDANQYGEAILSNVGVFQGSALIALLFTIYLADMTQCYNALNDKAGAPQRYHTQPLGEMHTRQLPNTIQKKDDPYAVHDSTGQDQERTTESEETKMRGDEIIYADDAHIIPEHDSVEQIILRLQNYDLVTHKRNVGINWGKVHIIT